MRRIARWILAASSLLVILGAFLCIISAWGARTFLTKGLNVGMEGIVTVIRSGETTLGRLENIVSETLPTAITDVESMLAADREPSRNIAEIQEKAVSHLRTELLPEIDQLINTAGTITQIIISANETLMIMNALPLIQLPPLPTKRWQSLNNRLSALRDSALELVNLLMRPKNSAFMSRDSEIRRNVQGLKNISQQLKDRLMKIKVDLSTILEKIEAIRSKITGWITWLLMGIFLVMFWVAGGQIYLLWHFWKTRSIRTD
jgi:hypothetical protein